MNDVFVEFLETLCHGFLYHRSIYPSYLFEQRSKYGLSVWRCRHPEVCEYIQKVLSNSLQLMEANMVDRFIITVYDSKDGITENIVDQMVIKYEMRSDALTMNDVLEVEEGLQALLLKSMMIDQKIPHKLSDKCNWALMVVTKNSDDHLHKETLESVLATNNWEVDNKLLPERRSPPAAVDSSRPLTLIPIKSVQNNIMSVSINAYI